MNPGYNEPLGTTKHLPGCKRVRCIQGSLHSVSMNTSWRGVASLITSIAMQDYNVCDEKLQPVMTQLPISCSAPDASPNSLHNLKFQFWSKYTAAVDDIIDEHGTIRPLFICPPRANIQCLQGRSRFLPSGWVSVGGIVRIVQFIKTVMTTARVFRADEIHREMKTGTLVVSATVLKVK